MAAARQWLHATTGRITTCAHSWMTAVHWVNKLAEKGLYAPARKHGPKWGPTTVAIAQEISALTECRPGIAYLMRKLKASERTIQYHLDMLRETGLLAYRSKGTRLRGGPNQSSVFERIIPVLFDDEHGIRTVGEGVQRRPVGAAPEHRKALGQLAKKAARKVRRRRSKRSSSAGSRCTPMQGGTSTVSSAAGTHSPSESKLASGEAESLTQKKSKRGPRTLNKVGRRHQLARELVSSVPWLHGASVPRIAWVARHCADAGWTALEVQAIAEQDSPILASKVRRPSGLLADRLSSLHRLFTTSERRKTAVDAWQESRVQEKARHQAYDDGLDTSSGPSSVSVQRIVAEAFARNREIAMPVDEAASYEIDCENPEQVPLESLDRELVKQMRAAAAKDPRVILSALETGMPEQTARRLYTHWLVDQALASQRRLAPAF